MNICLTKRSKHNIGVSLIVLMITIIVLIILVSAVIINLTGDNNILSQASRAVSSHNAAAIKEQVIIDITNIKSSLTMEGKSVILENIIEKSQDDGYKTKVYGIGRIKYDNKLIDLTLDKDFDVQENYHLLTGYWQNWHNNVVTTDMKLSQVPREYDIICVAFGTTLSGSPSGTINFSLDETLGSYISGGYTEQNFKDDIKVLKSRGQKVILSIGGSTGTIIVNDSASANNFVTSVSSLVEEYGFEGIDIDIESTIYPQFLASALNQLSQIVGSDFILTFAPQTVDFVTKKSGGTYYVAGSYYDTINNITDKSIIAIVNTQYFNSGDQYGQDTVIYYPETADFVTGLAATLLENGLSENQVGIGLHYLGTDDEVDGLSVETAIEGFDALIDGRVASGGSYTPLKAYSKLGGFMLWSINGDNKNGYPFTTGISEYYNSLK